MDAKGLEELKAAVVRQACFDYVSMIKKPGRKIHYDTKRGMKKYETEKSLTRWFKSPEFKYWSKGAEGEDILAQLQSNVSKGYALRMTEN